MKNISYRTGTLAALGFIALAGAVMAYLSVRRFASWNASMRDLGNVTQAVWSATRGEPLVYTFLTGRVSRLLQHMELFYYVLAIFYRLIPRPETLLAAQSILFAAGGWPVYRLASRKLGSPLDGIAALLIYLFYPVAQTAVLFDVHGDTLAMPFLLFAIDAADRDRWKPFAAAALLAASCKLYAVVAMALLAALLWAEGKRRPAILTTAACAAWALMLLGLRAALAAQLSGGDVQSIHQGLTDYLRFYLAGISDASGLRMRLATALIVALPALALGWRAPLWLLAGGLMTLPALMVREQGYNYIFHHYALAVPFLTASVVHGAARMREGSGGKIPGGSSIRQAPVKVRRGDSRTWGNLLLAGSLLLTVSASVLLVQTPISPLYYRLPYVSTNEIPAQAFTTRDQVKESLVREVPAGVPVWVNSFLAPRLVQREEVYVTRYERPMTTAEMQRIHDRVDVFADDVFNQEASLEALGMVAKSGRFSLQFACDGLFLFRSRSSGLPYRIQALPGAAQPGESRQIDEGIWLAGARAEAGENHTLQMSFDWLLTAPEGAITNIVIVTRLEGTQDARIVHLPSLAVLPASEWQPGAVYREEFTVQLPEDLPPGSYHLFTGWYDRSRPGWERTGEQGRIGEEVASGMIEVR